MICSDVIESERFNSLSVSARYFYIVLILNADDYGFVNSVGLLRTRYKIWERHLRELIDSGYILYFEAERTAVIAHWRLHNTLRMDIEGRVSSPELLGRIYVEPGEAYTMDSGSGVCDLGAFRALAAERGVTSVRRFFKATSLRGADIGELRAAFTEFSDGTRRFSGKKHGRSKEDASSLSAEKCEKSGKLGKSEESYESEEVGNSEDAFGDFPGDFSEESSGERLVFLGGIGRGVVMLSDAQMSDLLERLSLDEFNHYVGRLADFITEKGAVIKNHYATILKWASEDRALISG